MAWGWDIKQVSFWSLNREWVMIRRGKAKADRNFCRSKGKETSLNRGRAAGMMLNLYQLMKQFEALIVVMPLTEDKLYKCKYQARKYITCQITVHHQD